MGRKRLITDSYPVVKRREGSAGHREEPLPLSVDEAELELLRQFDLAWQYGPCTGITRLQRWHRAEQMGLKPPPEVRQVLQSHPGDPRFQCSLWHFYPPLMRHRRPAACYLRTGHKPEPVAAPRLSSAVENIWQKRGSQGRKEAESGGLTSRVPGPSLRINTAEARCPPTRSVVSEDKGLAMTLLKPATPPDLEHNVANQAQLWAEPDSGRRQMTSEAKMHRQLRLGA